MPAGIVHHLELVQVQIDQRILSRVAADLCHGTGKTGFEFPAIDQPRQRVVRGLVADLARQLMSLGDIVPLHEDARHPSILIQDRLIDEVDVPLHQGGVGLRLYLNGHRPANVRLAAFIDSVKQLKKALACDFRKRLPHRLAEDIPVADQLVVGVVRQFEDEVRPAANGHEARRLLHQRAKAPTLLLQMLVDLPRIQPMMPRTLMRMCARLFRIRTHHGGDLDRAIQDAQQLSVGVEHGHVPHRPVAIARFPIRGNRITKQRDRVRLAPIDHVQKRSTQLADGVLQARRKDIEQAIAHKLLACQGGQADVRIIDIDDDQLG